MRSSFQILRSILTSRREMHLTRGTLSSELVKLERDKYIKMSKEDKRKLYKCKNDYITLDEILTWPQFYSDQELNDENTGE